MTKYFDTKNGTLENAVLSVYEKKLDPVNKDAVKKKFDDRKDKDIDNDGDVDSSDKFLHKKRKAISKAMKKETEKESKMSKNENAYFRVDTMRDALKKVWSDSVKESDAYENDRFIVKGGKVKKDNSNTPNNKNHIFAPNAKIAKQLHSQGKRVYKESLEENKLEDSPNPANHWHMCAKNVVHEKWGRGNTIHSMHADPDKKGMVEWYDIWFQHGIEKQVPTKDLEIVHEEGHENHKKDKKDKELIKSKKMNKTMTGKPMSDIETSKEEKKSA